MTHLNRGHLFLAGFMGAGKSTVGRLLASELRCSLVDSDEMIVEREGSSIPDIFKSRGEEAFRALETRILREIAGLQPPAVVSLGGGAVVRSENWTIMRDSGLSCYLDWPLQTLLSRILNDKNRPLVAGIDKKDRQLKLATLWEERRQLYGKADFRIVCSMDMSANQVVDAIISKISQGI